MSKKLDTFYAAYGEEEPLESGTGSADNVGIAIDIRLTNAEARLPAVDDVVDDVDAIAAFRRVVIEEDGAPPPPPIPPPPIDDDD
uniref:Uncharacterized protein n=1 Tax=Caenorhabditis tropicalis TaxID=1561998 RepID=A0A1I7TT13_9PELO